MIRTCKLALGKPLAAVFKTYQEAPVRVVLSKLVALGVKKNGVMGWLASSTMDGSAAPAMPDVEAGPVNPMVA